jgi:hypothetical protein
MDTSRYRFIPGVSEVVDDIDIDALNLHDHAGNPITEASLAAEDEELWQRTYPGLRPGGKSLSGDGSHSPRFQIRLDKTTAAKAQARAAAEGKSPAKLLREIITHEFQDA